MNIEPFDTLRDNFDVSKVHREVVNWIRDWFTINGRNCNAIIGISGGKDSSVAAALCVEALGKDRVIGVLMPNGTQPDMNDSYSLVDFLGIKYCIVNIAEIYSQLLFRLTTSFTQLGKITLSEQSQINLPPRLRMSVLYAVSQNFNGRVVNTCNLSEDWVGYSTRYGDSVGDLSPLSNFTTDEVISIGRACGLLDKFVYKVPSDGLCGKTDEENLGFTYAELNKYIRTGVCENEATKAKIDALHEKNLFKLYPMDCFKY